MSVPESITERIAAGVEATLAAIVGDGANYWYTPALVKRCDAWAAWEPDWLDRKLDPTYYVKPGPQYLTERTSGEQTGILELFILASKTYTETSAYPRGQAPPIGWTLQERMKRDITRKLLLEVLPHGALLGLPNNVENIEVPDFNLQTPKVEGWSLIELHVKVSYTFLLAEP